MIERVAPQTTSKSNTRGSGWAGWEVSELVVGGATWGRTSQELTVNRTRCSSGSIEREQNPPEDEARKVGTTQKDAHTKQGRAKRRRLAREAYSTVQGTTV